MWRRLEAWLHPARAREIERLQTENDVLMSELGRVQRRFGGLARSVWQVQEDERRRLARELHDGVGQTLTALCHRIESLSGEDGGREDAVALCRQVLDDVRELSRLLRPPVLDDLGLAAALKWLGRRVRESHGIAVSVRADAGLEALPAELETLLFRVAQEAFSNAVRHGRPERISLSCQRLGNRVELRVHDDGQGFEPAASQSSDDRGVGLAGMHDRVALFGGDLLISSEPGRGTTVSASLILPDEGADERDTRTAG